MTDVFSDLHKAVTELFQACSERPFTLLEMPPIVIVTISSVPAQKSKGGYWIERERKCYLPSN